MPTNIAAWIHASHVKPTDIPLPEDPHWTGQYRRQTILLSSRSLDLDDCLVVPLDSSPILCACPPNMLGHSQVSLLLGLGWLGHPPRSLLWSYKGNIMTVRAAIYLDIERIETSISHLQESLPSLSEVVLQNRRLNFSSSKEGYVLP